MRPEAPSGFDAETSPEQALRDTFMAAFCATLHETRLMPMEVMAMAAAAVGAIYREIADAHLIDGVCPCGWQPRMAEDVATLQAALASSAGVTTAFDLRHAVAAGQA